MPDDILPLLISTVVCAVVAAGLALVLTPLSMRIARAWRVTDEPDARKVHAFPKPRLGGLAIIFAAVLSAASTLTALGLAGMLNAEAAGFFTLTAVLVAALVMAVVGLADDLWDLSGKTKLMCIVATGLGLYAAGLGFAPQQIVTRYWTVDLSWLAPLLTIGWVAVVVTAINFIDGLDGLAAGICVAAALVLAALGVSTRDPAVAVAAAGLGGALVGFLRYNRWPSRTFMGDGGSMFLGALIAALSLRTTGRSGAAVGWVLPAAAISLPLLDTALTVVRRSIIQRWPIFLAERGHIHHMLLDRGLPHHQVVRLMYAVTLLLIAGAGASLALPSAQLTFLGLLGCTVGLLLFFRVSGSPRFHEIWRALRDRRSERRDAGRSIELSSGLELRFKRARSFDAWWDTLVAAAQAFQARSMRMEWSDRNGSTRTLQWTNPTLPDTANLPTAQTKLPIPDRRVGPPMSVHLTLPIGEGFTPAAGRIATLARLLDAYPLANVAPLDTKARPGHNNPNLVRDMLTHGIRSTLRKHRDRTPPAPAPVLPAGPSAAPKGTRVAVVHDFLYTYAGAEKVLEQIINLYPDADIFSLFDFLPHDQRGFIRNKPVRTSFLQRMPMARRRHRAYLMLMPLAVEQLDVSDYDIVISSSYVAAKGVITRPDQLHVCYCHSPVRFAWDLQHQYLSASRVSWGPKSWLIRAVLQYIRQWDARSANGVDHFLSNSDFIGRRILKSYRRESTTVYPPVDVRDFECCANKQDFYVTASRMVPYKKIALIVEAFNLTPERRLIVVGTGPEYEHIARIAGPNVRLVGYQPQDKLVRYMQQAKAFVFAAEEDFGIVAVEAQAAGTPVIGFSRGGLGETVIDGETGVLFDQQTAESIVDACDRFEAAGPLSAATISEHAHRFSNEVFCKRFADQIHEAWATFNTDQMHRVTEPEDPITPAEPVDHRPAPMAPNSVSVRQIVPPMAGPQPDRTPTSTPEASASS